MESTLQQMPGYKDEVARNIPLWRQKAQISEDFVSKTNLFTITYKNKIKG